jgi:hypothetical protein
LATDPSVLLPVQDGAAAQCHAEGVKFVHVQQLALDFDGLTTIRPAPSTILRGEYNLELTQHSVQLTNGLGNAYNLTTYQGPSDLRTLSPDEVKQTILNKTHQGGPFDLLKPAFNLTSCQRDRSVVYGNLKTLIVKLALSTVHEQLFSVLVPGYSMEPHMVLDHIWQSYVDEKGVPVRLSAQVYYSTFLNAI